MKTFKIRYEFFDRNIGGQWNIENAIVLAEDDYKATELFYSEVEDGSVSVLDVEELTTKQIIWAY